MGSTTTEERDIGFPQAGSGRRSEPVSPVLNPFSTGGGQSSGTTGNSPGGEQKGNSPGGEQNSDANGDAHGAETGVGESTTSKSQRAPIRPSKAERDAHEVSHLPFRAWCSACVRARAKAHVHFHQHHEEEQVSTVSMDYMFLGSDPKGQNPAIAAKELPVLVVYDRFTKMICAHPVEHKGMKALTSEVVNPYPAKRVVRDLDRLGYKRVVVNTDQEPGILAVVRAIKEMWSGELVP